ncbi:MAG TPA: amidohydrolase family protein [Bryobacteraceae bacterium]|nr:amidohydrolase family protein [Bryobacteraceae bacterium]
MTRRSWLVAACGAALPSGLARAQAPRKGRPLDLSEYQPRSMLQVAEHIIERARFPVIDIHTHLSWAAKSEKGVPLSEERRYPAEPEELLPVMDRRNIRAMVNLTGGYGQGLREAVEKFDRKYPGRFYTFTEPCWSRANEPGYPRLQADLIEQAVRDGARGLKVLKTLGLYLRENITTGPLVKVDDRRFDPMWEVCGALQIPVAIHVSDPAAFFLPIDRFNERFEELNNHPDWSFYGGDFPSNAELLEARNRVLARHPKTQFIVLHVGNFAENLGHVSESMERFPNMHVEIGARIGELGRQPRTARRFFEKYQDRILFGTDAVPRGYEYPQQVFGDELYKIYYRFLETEDEYFDYAPAPVPPQGRWKIYGLGLPEAILRKVYFENAARLLRLA